MRAALIAIGACVVAAVASGPRCGYLELIGPMQTGLGESRDMPLYLAIPDTLASVNVRAFLAAEKDTAGILKRRYLKESPSAKFEHRYLKALRDWREGRIKEAADQLAALAPSAPARFKPMLRGEKTLLMYMAGLAADAEKDWLGEVSGRSACEEVAARNLYALYLGRNEIDKARGLADIVLQGEPRNHWAIEAKGYVLRMTESPDQWEEFLKEKSDGHDSLFDMQIAYGQFLKEQGRFEEARKYLAAGLEGSPRNGPAWLDLADVYERLGLPFLAYSSLQKCFQAGISDPYVYELLGRVLIDVSRYAADSESTYLRRYWGVLDMRDLQWAFDPAWAERCWRMAEKDLESGLPHALNSRSMAQLLYRLYCHNGKVQAANQLRANLWFHFVGPKIVAKSPLSPDFGARDPRLVINFGWVAAQLTMAAQQSDFFEPF